MRFLLDESAEFRLAADLESLGHEVTAIAHDYPPGLTDPQVLEIALREGRILVTNDRDFGELVFRRGLPHSGVIYFRMRVDSTAEQKASILQRVLREHAQQLDQFLVVDEQRVRVRAR